MRVFVLGVVLTFSAGCAHSTIRADVARVSAQLGEIPRCDEATNAPAPLDEQLTTSVGQEVERSGVLRPAHATCTLLLCHWSSPCCNGCGGEWVLEQGDLRLKVDRAPGVLDAWGGRDCSVEAVGALQLPVRVRGKLTAESFDQTTGRLARLRLEPSMVCAVSK